MEFKKPIPKNPTFGWKKFFDKNIKISVKDDTFSLFSTSIGNPEKFKEFNSRYGNTIFSKSPVLVLLHGGGTNSMSWALCVSELKKLLKGKHLEILAIDMRGHGQSFSKKNDLELDVETMTVDVLNVLKAKYKKIEDHQFIFAGHSLGGSIAINVVCKLEKIKDIYCSGFIVLDMVEGTAMESMQGLKNTLRIRPKELNSVNDAIRWNMQLTNIQMDNISISTPSQLIRNDKGKLVWRTPLEKTEKYWSGWWKGISKSFLQPKIPKMLIIPNMERLDTPLTIAHMQGKFVLKVVYGTSHFLHEQKPTETSKFIVEFLNKFSLV